MDLIASPYLLLLVGAYAFFSLGAYEARSGASNHGLPWALASLAVSLIVILLLDGDWSWMLGGQIALFFAIAVVRALRDN